MGKTYSDFYAPNEFYTYNSQQALSNKIPFELKLTVFIFGYSRIYSILDTGMRILGSSRVELLKNGSTVSKNGINEFVEPLV